MLSYIPMAIPVRFAEGVMNGTLVRYGCILKDIATGQILGHLKELAGLMILSTFPLNPLLSGASTVAQFGQWIDTHGQLRHIQSLLNHLQIVSSVGAVASVAGLGVGVAGFAVVMQRLKRLEQNLNEGMDRIRAEVEKLHLKLDMLSMANLQAAWQQLDGASKTNLPEREREFLKQSDRTFQRYRNYYYALIMEVRPVSQPQLSLPQVRQLYGRFFACALSELEANFLLHDFAHWHYRHEMICKQLAETCGFDAREALGCRVDALGLLLDTEIRELKEQMVITRDVCCESQVRIETAGEEVSWLDGHRVKPTDYLRDLRAADDVGLVLIPHEDGSA